MSPLSFTHSSYSLRTIVLAVATLLILAGFISYTAYQARFLIAGPLVTIASDESSVSEERVIVLEGTAANIARMTLNGRSIFTDQSGHFREEIVLENGYTTATIRAEDRYGREVAVERGFVLVSPLEETVAAKNDPVIHN